MKRTATEQVTNGNLAVWTDAIKQLMGYQVLWTACVNFQTGYPNDWTACQHFNIFKQVTQVTE